VSKPMGIGERNAGGVTMMARNKKRNPAAVIRAPREEPFRDTNSAAEQGSPLQPQIVIQQLNDFRGQRQEAKFVALAAHAELGFGKQCVLRIQSQHFGRPQAHRGRELGTEVMNSRLR
jgi:hypothetical protein